MPATEHTKDARRQHKEDYRRPRKCISPNTPDGHLTKSPDSCESLSLIPNILDAHRRDVFSAYPIPMRGNSLEALDEHLQVLHTEELVLEVTGGAQHPVLVSLFPASLQDPCLFTCFVAATQSIYEQRRSTGLFEPSDLLLSIKAKALGSIRDRIMSAGDGQDDNLIAGVVELMVSDSICGNIQSLISHQRGARKLIALRKGDVSDPLLQTMLGVLVVIEFYMALVQFLSSTPTTPPAGENPLRYLKHPFPASVCVRISTLPPGLQDLVLRSNLSLQTIGLLEAITSWSSAIQEMPSGSSTADTAYRRLFAEPMDCSRSAIFIIRHLRQSQSQFTIEYVLCLGIIIIIKHQRSTRKTDHIDDGLLQVFTQTVKQFARPSEIEAETLVWLVTAVAWRVHAMFPVHADDIVDHVIRTHESIRDIHAVQNIWSRFLWSDQFGGPWTRLWQAGLDRLKQHQQRLVTRSLSTEDWKHPQQQQQQQQQQATQPERKAEDCLFSRGLVQIKKEDSNESALSLGGSSSSTLSRSWTQSENSTRGSSQSNERGG